MNPSDLPPGAMIDDSANQAAALAHARAVSAPPSLVAAGLETLVAGVQLLTIARTRKFAPTGGGYSGDAQPEAEIKRLDEALEQLRKALA